jgi:serine/threonine-protein kinase
LFTASAGTVSDAANIDVVSVTDHRRKTLVQGGTFGRYLPSGHLVYVNRGTLFAVPFDVDRLEVHGTPVPVLEQVGYNPVDGSAQLAFSHTGTLLYPGGAGGGLLTVVWLDGTGKVQPLLAKPGLYGRPSLSPDGQRLALDVSDGSGTTIWVYDWPRDTMTRVSITGGAGSHLEPDGRYLVFRTVGAGMSMIRADGAGQPQPVTQSRTSGIRGPSRPTASGWRFMNKGGSFRSLDRWRARAGLRGEQAEPSCTRRRTSGPCDFSRQAMDGLHVR